MARGDGLRKLLYADDLVLTAESTPSQKGEGMEQRELKRKWKRQNQQCLKIRVEKRLIQEDGHVDAVEEGWEQTLCCVLSTRNGFINDAQV